MTYDWETMQAFEKLKTERALTPTPKPRKKRGTHVTWSKVGECRDTFYAQYCREMSGEGAEK